MSASVIAPVLLVRVAGELVGLPVPIVMSVLEPRPVRRLPHVRDEVVLGLTNVDGDLHVCVSLEVVLGHERPDVRRPPSPRGRLVALGRGRIEWIVPVDEVLGLPEVAPDTLEQAPATLTREENALVLGLFPAGDERAGLLDADVLLDVLRRRVA